MTTESFKIDNDGQVNNTGVMVQEDKDMYWMALGEIGATIFGIVVAVFAYRHCGDIGGLGRWLVTICALLVSFKVVNNFIHSGSESGENASE